MIAAALLLLVACGPDGRPGKHSPADGTDTDTGVGTGETGEDTDTTCLPTPEVCNGDDDDCDGEVDEDATDATEWPEDLDGDGYAGEDGSVLACEPPAELGDCDDTDPEVNPGASEICDGIDNDCDVEFDEDFMTWRDDDGDGWGQEGVVAASCPEGAPYPGDCDDTDPETNPGAEEACGVDADCDGVPGGGVDCHATWTLLGAWDGATDNIRANRGTFVDDLDGDGSPELATGNPSYHVTSMNPSCGGTVRLVLSSDVVRGENDADAIATEITGRDDGRMSGDCAGWALANGGDVDGDGTGDLLVGSPGDPTGGTVAGKVHVLTGTWLLAGGTDLELSPASFTGVRNDSELGKSLASAGDTDGDGLADLLFADEANGEAYLQRAADLASGSERADSTTLVVTGIDGGTVVVASAGDLDGDGLADVALGAPDDGPVGVVYLLYGGHAGELAAADADATYTGEAGSNTGGGLSALGDADGDGVDDLAVGTSGSSTTSVAWLLSGAAIGTTSAVAAELHSTGAAWDHDAPAVLTDLDGDGDRVELVVSLSALDPAGITVLDLADVLGGTVDLDTDGTRVLSNPPDTELGYYAGTGLVPAAGFSDVDHDVVAFSEIYSAEPEIRRPLRQRLYVYTW